MRTFELGDVVRATAKIGQGWRLRSKQRPRSLHWTWQGLIWYH